MADFPSPVPPPPNRNSPSDFSEKSDTFLGWMALFAGWLKDAGYPDIFDLLAADDNNLVTGSSVRITGGAVQSAANDIATTGKLTRVDGALHAALAHYGDYIGSGAAGSWNIDNMQPGEAIMHPVTGYLGTPVPAQPNVTHYWTRCQRIYANGASMQIAVPYRDLTNAPAPEASHVFYRLRPPNSATWGVWLRQLTQHSIVGTVGQSGGVPTGALIERGSNANGDYIRFADGTQICWRSAGVSTAMTTAIPGGFASAPVNWTYPIVFAFNPVAFASVAATTSIGAGVGATTTSTCPWFVTSAVSVATVATRYASLQANGRWF